jgi:uncharacterized tellurite resistance protein B-like protein
MFFKNDEKKEEKSFLINITALLIHAAKIDENYSNEEEIIIKKTLLELGADTQNLEKLINDAKIKEENSNQILDFTKEIKSMSDEKKIRIIEILWEIIYSNKNADMYESSLMRRLGGLLYIDSKIMGAIKDKVKNKNL